MTEIADTQVTEQLAATADTDHWTIKDLRARAAVSRKDIAKHTGLNDSVIWRAEMKENVTLVQRQQIVHFLIGCITDGKPEGTGRKGGRPRSTMTGAEATIEALVAKDAEIDRLTKQNDELNEQLANLTPQPDVTDSIYVSDIAAKIEELIADARVGKRAVKDLKAMLNWVNER